MASHVFPANDVTLTRPISIIDTAGFCLEFANVPVDLTTLRILALDDNDCLVETIAPIGGVSSWLDLTDTDPVSYAGQANFVTGVNAGANGMTLIDPAILPVAVNFYTNPAQNTTDRIVEGAGFDFAFDNMGNGGGGDPAFLTGTETIFNGGQILLDAGSEIRIGNAPVYAAGGFNLLVQDPITGQLQELDPAFFV